MTILLSSFAFFVAFLALWIASTMAKVLESQNRGLVNNRFQSIKDALAETDGVVNALAQRLDRMEKDLENFKSLRVKDIEILSTLEQKTRDLRSDLAEHRQRGAA